MAINYTSADDGRILTYPSFKDFKDEDGDRRIKAYVAMDTGQAYVYMPDAIGNKYRPINSPRTPRNPYVFQGS